MRTPTDRLHHDRPPPQFEAGSYDQTLLAYPPTLLNNSENPLVSSTILIIGPVMLSSPIAGRIPPCPPPCPRIQRVTIAIGRKTIRRALTAGWNSTSRALHDISGLARPGNRRLCGIESSQQSSRRYHDKVSLLAYLEGSLRTMLINQFQRASQSAEAATQRSRSYHSR